jgi:hypothetical protein
VQSNDDERLRYRIQSGKVTIVGALAKRLWELKNASEDSIYVMQERAIKAKHPIHAATIAKYLQGKGAKRPPEHTIRGLAAAFNNKITAKEIRDLLGMPSGEDGMWQPPEESARLSWDQRRALDTLIKAIVKPIDAVTEVKSSVVAGEPDNKVPEEVAATQQVGETRASTRRRTPGPGARKRTSTKKAKKHATAPTDATKDPAI